MTLTHRVQRLFGTEGQDGLYECGSCGRNFEYNRQLCPDCGCYRIERTTYDDLVAVE
ncbi:hypothetical protein OB955_02945 [Halobacteria archaeon AArc-m2/3/4]|uniref:DUF35 domain-containing protein n=1 Tax=Natronoglomus mannanivorans TaxID=2979990 RepID=A0AAP2YVN8_9EURY|nr:hypothetical protein [Halobacteria archaeon AArc-xg1-1]MCU4971693.1 hypothetical protein [Halobacteria archaeon AArc-m2/3/4]